MQFNEVEDKTMQDLTALFTNMRILKFKSQLTIAFFAAVNHNYDHNQRTLKHTKRIEIHQSQITNINLLNPLKFCFLRGPLR